MSLHGGSDGTPAGVQGPAEVQRMWGAACQATSLTLVAPQPAGYWQGVLVLVMLSCRVSSRFDNIPRSVQAAVAHAATMVRSMHMYNKDVTILFAAVGIICYDWLICLAAVEFVWVGLLSSQLAVPQAKTVMLVFCRVWVSCCGRPQSNTSQSRTPQHGLQMLSKTPHVSLDGWVHHIKPGAVHCVLQPLITKLSITTLA